MMFRFLLKRDSILSGILVGALIPFAGYAIFLMIFEQLENWGVMNPEGMSPNFRLRTSLLLGICLNIIPMQFYRKQYFYQSMRGLVFPTLAYVALWLVLFGPQLFQTT